ncbi:MAG: hypothetical protein M9894_05220 [Planctomycetes bacterium]|nr:hypothetical protein [Planctomycetota bacterium]
METSGPDHPLRLGGRALLGAGATELATFAAALLLVRGLGGDPTWATAGRGLAHALALALGAAVALAAAERTVAARGPHLGVAVGLALSPLAPLGGWYALDLAGSWDVAQATRCALGAVPRLFDPTVLEVLALALLGYAPAVLARRRGVGLLGQIAVAAWSLTAFGVLWHALGGAVLSTAGCAGLLLVRAVALPLGLALGDRLGAGLVRVVRREDAEGARPADTVRPRRAAPLAALAALSGLVLGVVGEGQGEPIDVTWARLTTRQPGERLALARRLISEGVRAPAPAALVAPAPGGRAWQPGPRGGWVPGPTPPPSFLSRRLLAGPADVAAVLADDPPARLPLHAAAVACLRDAARGGDVDAMIALAGVLHQGTRPDPSVRAWWGTGWIATPAERAEARSWARRAARAPAAPPSPSWRSTRRAWRWEHARADRAALALAAESPADAVRFARLLAERDPKAASALRELLATHRGLRLPDDDRLVAPPASWMRDVPGAWLAALAPADPPAVTEVVGPADALAKSARALWPHDPDAARRQALAALVRDPGHPGACALLAAFHLRAAARPRTEPADDVRDPFVLAPGRRPAVHGHVEVAEQHLAAVERRLPADPHLLLQGALCDAVRAVLHVDGDRGWARRALARLAVAEALAPDGDAVRRRRADVVGVFRAAGVEVEVPRRDGLLRVAEDHERRALAALHEGDGRAARAYAAAAARLRRLAGE